MVDLPSKLNMKGFVDLSDYARPLGNFVARKLKNSKIFAYQITLLHFLVMLVVIQQFSVGERANIFFGIVLLQLKNILDASDGSLARLQNRPSKFGRFLDSNLDFIGNILLFCFLPSLTLVQKFLSAFFFIFQGSFYNYYYILLRSKNGGELTSKTKENSKNEYSYDNPKAVKWMFFMYKFFYAWQDKIIDFIEVKILKSNRLQPSGFWVSLLTLNGLGFQYLIVSFFLFFNLNSYIPFYFIVVMNVFLVVVLFSRYLTGIFINKDL